MAQERQRKELIIHPCGETEPWEFHTGSWCGDAKDSVGFFIRGCGGAFKREDVIKLRTFLELAEATWSDNPLSMPQMFPKA